MHVNGFLCYFLFVPPKNDIAIAIRALRTHLGLSQQQFSDRIGVTLRTVAHYENDRPPADPRTTKRIYEMCIEANRFDLADVFFRKYSPDELFSIEDNIILIWLQTMDLRLRLHRNERLEDLESVLLRIQYYCTQALPGLEPMIVDLDDHETLDTNAFLAKFADELLSRPGANPDGKVLFQTVRSKLRRKRNKP